MVLIFSLCLSKENFPTSSQPQRPSLALLQHWFLSVTVQQLKPSNVITGANPSIYKQLKKQAYLTLFLQITVQDYRATAQLRTPGPWGFSPS
jgi:hypothetical protein